MRGRSGWRQPNGAALDVSVCPWDELPGRGWQEAFDVVLCVGNSLPHAVGRAGRRTALYAMAGCLRPGGRRGLPIYAWTIPAHWDEPHHFDVAVALVAGDGTVQTCRERFAFWPFTQDELR